MSYAPESGQALGPFRLVIVANRWELYALASVESATVSVPDVEVWAVPSMLGSMARLAGVTRRVQLRAWRRLAMVATVALDHHANAWDNN